MNLIIVRDQTCIAKRNVLNNISGNVLCGSDNYSVAELVRSKYFIETINLQVTIPFRQLHDSSVNYINKLNEIIEVSFNELNFKYNFSKNIIFISKHFEGGDVSQKIFDILRYEKMYYEILVNEKINKIIIFKGRFYNWEDEVLKSVAVKLGIICEEYHSNFLLYNINKILYKIKYILKTSYYFLLTMKIIFFYDNSFSSFKLNKTRLILLQLCSDAEKHYLVIKDLANRIKNSKFSELIIGWKSSRVRNKFSNLNYINLEKLLSFKDLFSSIIESYRLYKNTIEKVENGLNSLTQYSYSLNLIELKLILKMHFLCDLSDRLRHFYSLNKLRETINPVAVRPWTRVLYEAVVLYEVFKIRNSVKYFWQPSTDYLFKSPEIEYLVPANIIFAISAGHKEVLISNGFESEKIFVIGNPWSNRINNFLKSFDRNYSLAHYNIRVKYKLIIFFDSSYVNIHYSIMEQLNALNTLLNLCSNYDSLCLIVKPHIGYRGNYIEEIINKTKLKNVYLICKFDSPYHALNCCDILISKFSNIILEAMLFSKPTICLLFDRNEIYKIHGNNCQYIYNVADLDSLIKNLLSNRKFLFDWKTTLIKRYSVFLEKHLQTSLINSSNNIVSILEEQI